MEIEEETSDENGPLASKPEVRSVRTNVPEVEVHLYHKGNGPIKVFKCRLTGWEQDQLEVGQILDKYGFKSIYAFNPDSGRRGVLIRFNPRNGRSISTYIDGSVIHVDGDPENSSVEPITKIAMGALAITILILILSRVIKDPPEWAKELKYSGFGIPPWVIVGAVILFVRLRKGNFQGNRN